MNAKLALKSVVAFGLALFVGFVLFKQPVSKAPVAGGSDAANQVVLASASSLPSSPDFAPGAPGHAKNINKDWVPSEGGLKNDNQRMQTTVSNLYANGMKHVIEHQFGATIEWSPASQEIRRGSDAVSVPTLPQESAAHIEKHGASMQVVYPATYPSTDEYLYVRPDGGIEHDIILKKQPVLGDGLGLAYSGYIKIGPGLTMWDGKTEIKGNYTTKHGVNFKNKIGNTVFYLNPPIAYDAIVALPSGGLDKEKQAFPQNQKHELTCEYQINFDAKGINLAIVTPASWLLAPDRAYPVTIDPTFGPFGLADGDPPIYIGAVGSNTLIPAFNGGTKMPIEEVCPIAGHGAGNNGYGHIVMPFDFSFYPALALTNSNPFNPTGPALGADGTFLAGDYLFVHIDGFASFDPPTFNYADEIPPDIAENPCFDSLGAFDGKTGQIPDGQYPTDGAFYPLWNDLHFSSDPQSGIYYYTDGVAPTRRLIIEWHKMNYVADDDPNDVISFNLILYECQGIVEVIVGDPTQGDSFYGDSTIGIESPGDIKAVAYDLYAPPAPMAMGATMVDGLDVTFSTSPLGTVMVTVNNNNGCIPWTTCYQSTVNVTVPLCVQLQGGLSTPPSFGFHWEFGDGSEGFTQNICHTYSTPETYNPILTVTDDLGNSTTFSGTNDPTFVVNACDIPPVIISANPQGGTAPLSVTVTAYSTSPFVLNAPPPAPAGLVPTISTYDNANTSLIVDQLGTQNEPGQVLNISIVVGGKLTQVPTQGGTLTETTVDTISSTFLFDTPGTYRITGSFPGTSFTLPTTGTGVIYIDVVDPNSSTDNSLIITESNFKIDWAGKIPNLQNVAPRPADDTITVNGYINLTGLDLSSLAGQEITLALNGYDPIFDGILDANGHAVQGDFAVGKTGSISISAPSGKFTCSVKGNYGNLTDATQSSLGVISENAQTLLTAHYRVQIGNVFNSPGTTVAYGYTSKLNKSATGSFKFGQFYPMGSFFLKGLIPGAPAGIGQVQAQELLVSGGFLVTAADFKLLGDTVSMTLSGLLARSGGDDLRPAAKSNVVVTIGNYTETLNFSTTPTFKTTGKPPAQKFSFKSKGGTNIQTLSWMNKAGVFQISAINLPNSQVGINTTLARQPLALSFTITPENNQQYLGKTTFDILKVSDTEFTH